MSKRRLFHFALLRKLWCSNTSQTRAVLFLEWVSRYLVHLRSDLISKPNLAAVENKHFWMAGDVPRSFTRNGLGLYKSSPFAKIYSTWREKVTRSDQYNWHHRRNYCQVARCTGSRWKSFNCNSLVQECCEIDGWSRKSDSLGRKPPYVVTKLFTSIESSYLINAHFNSNFLLFNDKGKLQLTTDNKIKHILSRRNQQFNALFYRFYSWSRFATKPSKKKLNRYFRIYLHSGTEGEHNKLLVKIFICEKNLFVDF